MGHALWVTSGHSVHHQPGNSFHLSSTPTAVLMFSSILLESTLLLLPKEKKKKVFLCICFFLWDFKFFSLTIFSDISQRYYFWCVLSPHHEIKDQWIFSTWIFIASFSLEEFFWTIYLMVFSLSFYLILLSQTSLNFLLELLSLFVSFSFLFYFLDDFLNIIF